MTQPVYVLGTGLSHDGSAFLLKDGVPVAAIEKERLTRKKHDGGNDQLAVQYCLDAAGIKAHDLTLIVQTANFGKDSIARGHYLGPRAIADTSVPVLSISHHLAHAWSAAAAAPYPKCAVLVIDGCGSPLDQCDDLQCEMPVDIGSEPGMYCEKDSFYLFDNGTPTPLIKDLSVMNQTDLAANFRMPTIRHSIGGVYSAASNYCFGNMDDAGKLMGLAPYGKPSNRPPIFLLAEGRVFVKHGHFDQEFCMPRTSYKQFTQHFQHYADIARWVQSETTRAVSYLVKERMKNVPAGTPLALAGGVALNAVTNAALMREGVVKDLFIQPAAGDNGLAIGCAWYGHIHHQDNKRTSPSKSIFLGRNYSNEDILKTLQGHSQRYQISWMECDDVVKNGAEALANGKTIGWFQGGAELGPRALGHRSILADPRLPDIQLHINKNIKNREDFRPFAPSVLQEKVNDYFVDAWYSPYMILTDLIRPEWADKLKGVVHVDGSCRVQTVDASWNERFHQLIAHFGTLTGTYVLLNTSFNVRGMPIVETPAEALEVFLNSAMDELYLNEIRVVKKQNNESE
ncbi:MAG: hypothetical protein JNM41_09490 [Flavipsychrobacter sp.]|nr:hypothetical protein [Flavipsychrobacter sp.]